MHDDGNKCEQEILYFFYDSNKVGLLATNMLFFTLLFISGYFSELAFNESVYSHLFSPDLDWFYGYFFTFYGLRNTFHYLSAKSWHYFDLSFLWTIFLCDIFLHLSPFPSTYMYNRIFSIYPPSVLLLFKFKQFYNHYAVNNSYLKTIIIIPVCMPNYK